MGIERVDPRMIGPIPVFTGEVLADARALLVLADGTWVYVPVGNLPGGSGLNDRLELGEVAGDGPSGVSFDGGEIGVSDGESYDGGEIV